MRVAALYDVHGNLPALEAALEEIGREGFDRVVVGGDVVFGPMPVRSLARLTELETPARFLVGNTDREVVARRQGRETKWYRGQPEARRAQLDWVAGRLDDDGARTIGSWPATVELEIDGLGRVLFCHATPRNDVEIFTRLTSEAVLLPVFAGVDAALLVCGHTHMQFDRRVGGLRVVNAGSVGMPFGPPGAYWLALGPGVELRRTEYDLDRAARRVRATGFPGAAEFASRQILEPPTERQMLDLFGPAELSP
ncbi:MAG: metallophosphoesterase family protein [Thermoanaerobaculia bacterium]|nr:metallophosphoesterase family protein [Thermoanaerobaculia bacterium]